MSLDTGYVAALSPEGTRIVFVSTVLTESVSSRHAGKRERGNADAEHGRGVGALLFTRRTVGGVLDSWKAKKTRLDGVRRSLCDARRAWRMDGRGRMLRAGPKRLVARDTDGGVAARITELGESRIAGPRFCRGQGVCSGFRFSTANKPGPASLSRKRTPEKVEKIDLPDDGGDPRYLPTGHLVYVANGTSTQCSSM